MRHRNPFFGSMQNVDPLTWDPILLKDTLIVTPVREGSGCSQSRNQDEYPSHYIKEQ